MGIFGCKANVLCTELAVGKEIAIQGSITGTGVFYATESPNERTFRLTRPDTDCTGAEGTSLSEQAVNTDARATPKMICFLIVISLSEFIYVMYE